MEYNFFDATVIGGGLSGLIAGIRLQRSGMKVLIVEKKSVAGGLCGTKIIDGYEFSIACNDFGTGLKRELEALNIDHSFIKAKTRFFFDHGNYNIPANFNTAIKLLPHLLDLNRFGKAIRKNEFLNLQELIEVRIGSPKAGDTLSMFAYLFAMAPGDVTLKAIKQGFSKEFNYGYENSIIPEGGPKNLIDALIKKFKLLGGRINYNEEYVSCENENGSKKIVTDKNNYFASYLISSLPRWDKYPENLKETLPISMMYLALKSSYKFPDNFTTIAYLPPNVIQWMNETDKGILPDGFGFHIVKSDLLKRSDHYTVTINFLSPRGMEDWSYETIKKASAYILTQVEKLLPGFQQSILYQKFVSPSEFKILHGLSSQNFKYVLNDSFTKPPAYDETNDVYHIGNSVYPPGEHAGGAVLSAVNATKAILEKLK